jgi:zinc transport system substrate-binding protein
MRAILVTITALTLLGAACGDTADGEAPGGGTLSVIGTFYPLYEVASQVGGGIVEAANLTPAGVEPHDVELNSRQVDSLLDADLVLYLGSGFQPAVEQVLESRDGPSVDLLAGMPVMEGSLEDEEHEAGHEEEEGEAVDPHVWLDPVIMAEIVDQVAAELSALDSAHADEYVANAAAYRDTLTALDHTYESTLADCERDIMVTTHAAFGYLAKRYGLRQESLTGLSPEAEPNPQRFAELADLVQREDVTTVFSEELVPADLAEALAREAGVATAVLSPIEGLTADEQDSGATYLSVMEENLAALSKALGCGSN